MENSKDKYLVIKGKVDLSIWSEIQDLAKGSTKEKVKAVGLLFDSYKVIPDEADDLLLNLAGQKDSVQVRRRIAKRLVKRTGIPWVLHVKVLEVLSKDKDKQVQDAVQPMWEAYKKIMDSLTPMMQAWSEVMKNMVPPKLSEKFAEIGNIPQLRIPPEMIENLKRTTTYLVPDLILPLADSLKNVRLPDLNRIYADKLLNVSNNQVGLFKNALQIMPSYSYSPYSPVETGFPEVLFDGIEVSENPLVSKLRDIPSGISNWHDYQKVCQEIMDYCFVPPLLEPYGEVMDQAGIHRRDVVYPIPGGVEGFWGYIQMTHSAKAVIVDAKNYGNELPPNEVVIVSKYFGPRKLGNFGIIISRKGPSASAKKEQIDRWVHHEEMIICLSDDALEEMVHIKERNGKPWEVLDRKIFEIMKSA